MRSFVIPPSRARLARQQHKNPGGAYPLSLLNGIRTFADGVSLTREPKLLRYAWIPALLSLAIVSAVLAYAFGCVEEFSDFLVARLPSWLGFLHFILVPLLYLFGVLTSAWLAGLLAAVIASPLLGDLSLATEQITEPESAPQPPSFFAGLASAMGREGRKLIYYLPRLIGVAVLSVVPVINVAAPLAWLLFGAWTLAVQFADYPAENRGLPFQATLTRLKAHRGTALGFGACATLALGVPLLNFLLVPVAVVGGTLLWQRTETSAVG